MSKHVVHATTGAIASDDLGIDSEDLHYWAASTNRSNQIRMLRSVAQAHLHAGGRTDAVAEALEVDESVVSDALAGRTDLTLTEMRFLFSACEVVVDYTVRPARAARAASMWSEVVSHVIDSKPQAAVEWENDSIVLLAQRGNTWAKVSR